MNMLSGESVEKKHTLQLSLEFDFLVERSMVSERFIETSAMSSMPTQALNPTRIEPPALAQQAQPNLELGEWNDREIILLMEGVLLITLRSLNDQRCASRERQEALEWVMSDDLLPFSFAVCCRAIGYDHEQLRDSVLASIKMTTH